MAGGYQASACYKVGKWIQADGCGLDRLPFLLVVVFKKYVIQSIRGFIVPAIQLQQNTGCKDKSDRTKHGARERGKKENGQQRQKMEQERHDNKDAEN